MSLPYPAFLALAATLLVQVGALVWIFSDRPRASLVAKWRKLRANRV